MEGTDVRPVEVSRELSDSLYELQQFLIRIEEAVPEADFPKITQWANDVGSVIGGWQEHDVVVKSVELSLISYVVYTNPQRTLMMRCWRGEEIVDGRADWRLETAMRDNPSAIWRAPHSAGKIVGTLSGLRDFVDGYADLDPGTEEIERVREVAV